MWWRYSKAMKQLWRWRPRYYSIMPPLMCSLVALYNYCADHGILCGSCKSTSYTGCDCCGQSWRYREAHSAVWHGGFTCCEIGFLPWHSHYNHAPLFDQPRVSIWGCQWGVKEISDSQGFGRGSSCKTFERSFCKYIAHCVWHEFNKFCCHHSLLKCGKEQWSP